MAQVRITCQGCGAVYGQEATEAGAGLPLVAKCGCCGSRAIKIHRLKTEVVMWDWKEDAPIDEINTALQKVNEPQATPCLVEIENSEDDQHYVVVASADINQQQARAIWGEWKDEVG